MFEHIRGKILKREKDECVVEIGGFAFRFRVVPFMQVEEGEEQCFLLRSFLKESGEFIFYGFREEEERRIFDILREVRGVNHRTAFKILSRVYWKELVNYVLEEDVRSLEEKAGISNKTAKRLVVELRPRLLEVGFRVDLPQEDVLSEAKEVLFRLGYTPSEVNSVVAGLFKDVHEKKMDVEEVIKQALLRLGGRG
ncbi:MAG: Holliday junction branch migration protein RuvA [Candidatus Caldatribacteriaceae bacterium]